MPVLSTFGGAAIRGFGGGGSAGGGGGGVATYGEEVFLPNVSPSVFNAPGTANTVDTTYSWTVPEGVNSISFVAVGGGGGGSRGDGNNFNPQSVADGGTTSITIGGTTYSAYGGEGYTTTDPNGGSGASSGGTYSPNMDGGGTGGISQSPTADSGWYARATAGGGGAAGYSGNGGQSGLGDGGVQISPSPGLRTTNGSGGGGGGGFWGGGGGVGIYGQGPNGTRGNPNDQNGRSEGGGGGSYAMSVSPDGGGTGGYQYSDGNTFGSATQWNGNSGGYYGGGGGDTYQEGGGGGGLGYKNLVEVTPGETLSITVAGGGQGDRAHSQGDRQYDGRGGPGALRIVWGFEHGDRTFPTTNVGLSTSFSNGYKNTTSGDALPGYNRSTGEHFDPN